MTEDPSTLTLQAINERISISLDEIKKRKRSSYSIMPEGLLTPLTAEQRADLIAYLSSPHQVPLPQSPGNP